MNPCATPLLPYKGKRMFRFPVRVRVEFLGRTLQRHETLVHVVAPTQQAATELVVREFSQRLDLPFSAICYGPRGGEYRRFIGYKLMTRPANPAGRQLFLFEFPNV